MIGVQHLFIGAEHLRYFLDRFIYISTQDLALVVNGLLHQCHALACRIGTLHRIVVDSAKAEGICVFIYAIGLDPCLPIVLHRLAVGDVVEVAICAYGLPFAFVVAEHLFAVRCSHNDSVVIGQTCIFRIIVERLCARVHCRP